MTPIYAGDLPVLSDFFHLPAELSILSLSRGDTRTVQSHETRSKLLLATR